MPRPIAVGLFKDNKLIDVFPSTAAAAEFLGTGRRQLHKAFRMGRAFKGCYTVKKHIEGRLFEEHLENFLRDEESPANRQPELDIEGLINLFTELNKPCYCELHPGYRVAIARTVIKRYRHARDEGNDRDLSVAYAHQVAGIECCDRLAPLHRGWKDFFDYKEASRIVRRGPSIYYPPARQTIA